MGHSLRWLFRSLTLLLYSQALATAQTPLFPGLQNLEAAGVMLLIKLQV